MIIPYCSCWVDSYAELQAKHRDAIVFGRARRRRSHVCLQSKGQFLLGYGIFVAEQP